MYSQRVFNQVSSINWQTPSVRMYSSLILTFSQNVIRLWERKRIISKDVFSIQHSLQNLPVTKAIYFSVNLGRGGGKLLTRSLCVIGSGMKIFYISTSLPPLLPHNIQSSKSLTLFFFILFLILLWPAKKQLSSCQHELSLKKKILESV